jgi:hypothetical protein
MTTNNGAFGTIDLNTGVFSPLGNSGLTLSGLGVANGVLYGTNFGSTLYAINLANGSLTTVGSSGVNYSVFGSTNNGLFALNDNGTALYAINPANGAATPVGITGIALGDFSSLSNNSDTLYFVNTFQGGNANVYTIDTNTGLATLIGSNAGGQFIGGIVLEQGTLFAGEATPGQVDTIDPATGVITEGLAITGTSDSVYGLAELAEVVTYAAQVQQPINSDGSSVFSVKRGVVPVKFTLTLNGTSTCNLPPATIALTRTAGGTIGPVDETTYVAAADTGSNFRISSCQYVYNLNSSALGVGTYRVDILINGQVVGSGIFGLK